MGSGGVLLAVYQLNLTLCQKLQDNRGLPLERSPNISIGELLNTVNSSIRALRQVLRGALIRWRAFPPSSGFLQNENRTILAEILLKIVH